MEIDALITMKRLSRHSVQVRTDELRSAIASFWVHDALAPVRHADCRIQ